MGKPIPETPEYVQIEQKVSANAYFDAVVGEERVRLQITARKGATPEEIFDCTKNLLEAYAMLRTAYPRPEKAEAVPEPKQEHPAPEDGTKKPYEQRPIPTSEIPPDLPTGESEGGPYEYYRDEFDRFEIKPEVDDKATVLFYKGKLEFPVGARINKWKNKNVVTMLAPLGDFDVTKPQEVKKSGLMYWTKGSEYTISKGVHAGQKSHYKDLRLIEVHND